MIVFLGAECETLVAVMVACGAVHHIVSNSLLNSCSENNKAEIKTKERWNEAGPKGPTKGRTSEKKNKKERKETELNRTAGRKIKSYSWTVLVPLFLSATEPKGK